MLFWLLQATTLPLLSFISFFPFSDADRAIQEGVFSATSTQGYSLQKSLILFGSYLACAALAAFISRRWVKKDDPPVTPQTIGFPRISKSEWIIVGVVVSVLSGIVFFTREQIFNTSTIYSEEFYNLAALVEFEHTSFDIIYPYSFGNLFLLRLFSTIGLSSVSLKVVLNMIGLILAYFAISTLTEKKWARLSAYGWLLVFFIQPLISPSLHRNILRFLLPALVVVGLHILSRWKMGLRRTVGAHGILISAVLFFGSADIIVLSGILYLLHIGVQWMKDRDTRKTVCLLLISPLLSCVVMWVVFGRNYILLLKQQLLSITVYSGYANTTPYFDLMTVISSPSFGEFLKQTVYALCYYLPIFIMGGIIMFIVLKWKKDAVHDDRYILLSLLTVAYILYFRQNFGDAGVGRIGIASTVLLFIALVLRRFSDAIARQLWRYSLFFFIIITAVSLYFFRYSVIDLVNAKRAVKTQSGLVPCHQTFLAEPLEKAGFLWCNTVLIQELERLDQVVGDDAIYVYDDTFSLYYLLDKRPIVLIPTYYMAYTRQDEIVQKMHRNRVTSLIYPKTLHFFGVPETYVHDPRFMKQINAYRDQAFEEVSSSTSYQVFSLK